MPTHFNRNPQRQSPLLLNDRHQITLLLLINQNLQTRPIPLTIMLLAKSSPQP